MPGHSSPCGAGGATSRRCPTPARDCGKFPGKAQGGRPAGTAVAKLGRGVNGGTPGRRDEVAALRGPVLFSRTLKQPASNLPHAATQSCPERKQLTWSAQRV